ncbi:TPA: hypothetical protein N0F65_010565 [Lagenidium giganteum]|uniref:Uncharacterized protein n=1 Tax=Lagenidium giganteum TaxID=4803 RepID=A0AAV2YMD6_9STRA|nr:TPA: hypothetical protein N0F65_010565 [Lagenidium giganteum]
MGRRTRPRKEDVALWKTAKKGNVLAMRTLLQQPQYAAAAVEMADATALFGDRAPTVLDDVHPVKGTTPLMIAAARRHSECVRALVAAGASVNVVDATHHQNTALHYAAYQNDVVSIEVLLKAGADAHALNRKGHSALDVARIRGKRDGIQTLMQHSVVHSGWLSIQGRLFWKRRWCVLLASSADRSVLELAIYKHAHDLRPKLLLLLEPGAQASADSCKLPLFDRPHTLRITRPIAWQVAKRRRVCRDVRRLQATGGGMSALPLQVLLAAENAAALATWINAISNPVTQPGTVVTIPHASTYSIGSSVSSSRSSSSSLHIPLAEMQSLTVQEQPAVPVRAAFVPVEPAPSAAPSPSPAPAPVAAAVPVSVPRDDPTDVVKGIPVAVDAQSTLRVPEPSAPRFDSFIAPDYVDLVGVELASSTPQLPVVTETEPSAPSLSDSASARGECSICMDAVKNAICIPCGHIAGCVECLQQHAEREQCCPICRAHVTSVIKVYEC